MNTKHKWVKIYIQKNIFLYERKKNNSVAFRMSRSNLRLPLLFNRVSQRTVYMYNVFA
jgi:hypothetical protein